MFNKILIFAHCRMGLLTDYHFKVKNTRNIFAVGDCPTIKDDQFTHRVNEVFGSYFQQQGINLSKDQIEGAFFCRCS